MSQGLVIMQPMAVTDAMLVSCTVPEADAPLWAAGTTYAVGDVVRLASTHAVYENTSAGNIGKSPDAYPNLWVRVRATNRWRCLDRNNSAATAQASNINYVFAPGLVVQQVALIGLVGCSSARVRMVDPTYGTVYDQTRYPGPLPALPDPWEWAFGEWSGGQSQLILAGMPSYPNANLWVDLVGGPTLALGYLLFGQPKSIGRGVQYGVRLGRAMYSKVEANKYGEFDLLKRPTARKPSFEVLLDRAELDSVMYLLDEIEAQVCLVSLSDQWESTTLVGVVQNADISIEHHGFHNLNLELLGVV